MAKKTPAKPSDPPAESTTKTNTTTKKTNAAKPRSPRLGRGLSSMMGRPVAVQPPAGPQQPDQSNADASTPASKESAAATRDPATNTSPDEPAGGITHLDPALLRPNRHQPRQTFDDASLDRLAASIKADGLMQPVVARKAQEGDGYEIIAGERRWRAAKKAGLAALPVLIRDVDDQQAAELALIENLQREDLNPLDRAQAFASLVEQFDLTHAQVADRVGIDRSSVSNLIRLLELAPEVQDLVRGDTLSLGQARALLSLPDAGAQAALAHQAVAEGLSVRAVEERVRQAKASAELTPTDPGKASTTRARAGGAHFSDLEQTIGQQLGTRVRIKPGRKKGTGSLTVEFHSLDAFDDLLGRLGVSLDEDS